VGGAVVEELVRSKKFCIRGLCHPRDFAESRELQCEGCEMVETDVSSQEDLRPLFTDAVSAFIITDSLDPTMHLRESEIGMRLINAAKDSGVKHMVFCSLPNINGISKGKYNVPSFSQKAEVERNLVMMQYNYDEKAFSSVTIVRPGFYFQNFRRFFHPTIEGKKLIFTMPATEHKIESFNAEDIGVIICKIFEEPLRYDRQRIDVAMEALSPKEFISTIRKVSGIEVELNEVSRADYPKVHEPWADEMAELFGFIDEFGFFGPHANFTLAKLLNPNMIDFETFLTSSEWAAPEVQRLLNLNITQTDF
jgi:uncharacterized protein YbjT (DUF2867 family)